MIFLFSPEFMDGAFVTYLTSDGGKPLTENQIVPSSVTMLIRNMVERGNTTGGLG